MESMRSTLKKTKYTLEVNYSFSGPMEYLPETDLEHLFNNAVGFMCQSNGYGEGYRNATFYFKDLGNTVKAFKRATKVARKLIREGKDIQVQIHALMR